MRVLWGFPPHQNQDAGLLLSPSAAVLVQVPQLRGQHVAQILSLQSSTRTLPRISIRRIAARTPRVSVNEASIRIGHVNSTGSDGVAVDCIFARETSRKNVLPWTVIARRGPVVSVLYVRVDNMDCRNGMVVCAPGRSCTSINFAMV